MGLDKQFTFNGLQGFDDFLQPNKYTGILLTAEGTYPAAQVSDLLDLGQVIISRNDEPKCTRNFSQYAKMNDLRGGKSTLDGTNDTDFSAVVAIPFFAPGQPNMLNIQSLKELSLQYVPAAGSALDDVQIIAYGITNNSLPAMAERYNYRITGEDDDWTRSLQAESFNITKRNVTELYIDDLDDTINSLSFESNGKQVVTTTEKLALQGLTNLNNPIEDSTFDVIKIDNHTPGREGSMINRNNEIVLNTSGAGAYEVTCCSIEPLPNFGK